MGQKIQKTNVLIAKSSATDKTLTLAAHPSLSSVTDVVSLLNLSASLLWRLDGHFMDLLPQLATRVIHPKYVPLFIAKKE